MLQKLFQSSLNAIYSDIESYNNDVDEETLNRSEIIDTRNHKALTLAVECSHALCE